MRQRRAEQFRETARARAEEESRPAYYGREAAEKLDSFRSRPQEPEKEKDEGGGGGLWGKVKGVAGDVGGAALDVLSAPQRYVGAPAFALASGQVEAERRFNPETGQYYREKPGFGDVLRAFGEALTRDPRETYSEAREAFQERLRNPEVQESAWARPLLEGASDPLMAIPAGATGRLASRLPAGALRTALTSSRSPIGGHGRDHATPRSPAQRGA